jgi:hypothetical protein
MGVDLDALLLLLITEHNMGSCPRAPVLSPRRLTDGALFNLFNLGGHSSQVAALADGRAAAVMKEVGSISSPPRSPLAGANKQAPHVQAWAANQPTDQQQQERRHSPGGAGGIGVQHSRVFAGGGYKVAPDIMLGRHR